MASIKCNSLVVEVTHLTEIYGPAQALENYLKQNSSEFLIIAHPLSTSSLNYSTCKTYVNGGLRRTTHYRTLKSPEVISYIQHFLLTLYILLFKVKRKIGIYIGIDNLNAFTGVLLKTLGLVDKVIFYVIDYTPIRFKNKIINSLYHILNVICVKHTNYVWNVSKRIASLWKMLGIDNRKNIVVPIGVELKKVRNVLKSSSRKNVLVYAGHITKSKGIQLAIEAMEEVIRYFPDVTLEIIGTGPFERELKEMVKRKNLEKWVKFLGRMKHDELMRYLPTCGIALATYEPDPNNITYYADPTKPKEYLACGLPVIITKVPWIAKEIEKAPMGIAINYDKYELVSAVTKLLSDESFYEKCRESAMEFASKLDWNKIFGKAFTKIQREDYE
jgi:glycosyltransferase involved in cell wall biosynthesis